MARINVRDTSSFEMQPVVEMALPSYLRDVVGIVDRRRIPIGTSTGGGGGATPPSATTAPAPTVAVSASDLQFIINSIPTAQDGHVITADTHNAMVFALRALATRLGVSGTAGESLIITPQFRKKMTAPATTVAEWEVDTGIARKSNGNTNGTIHGWMEVELPHNSRILSMEVFGTKTGTGTVTLRLIRQQIANPSTAPALIELQIPEGHDATRPTPPADVTLPGMGAGAQTISEFRVVNNNEHKYIVTADITGGDAALTAQVNAIKISCGF